MKSLFRFFSSLKLAVFSLLLLSTVLAVATFLGSAYGMKGSQLAVYSTWWFNGVLFLLGVNVLCAALSRFPWKPHQTGFVLTHLGIITILVGAFLTQRYGLDGNMPVSEHTQEGQVILNDLIFTVLDEKGGFRESYPVKESYVAREGKLMEIGLSTGESLVVDRYIPRAVVEKRMRPSPAAGVGVPAMRLELFNSRFNVEEWLTIDNPTKPSELNLGPAVVTFQKLWSPAEEKKFLESSPRADRPALNSGSIVLSYGGRDFHVKINLRELKKWQMIPGSDLEWALERYLPYAVVENGRLVSKSSEPVNPAAEVTVRVRSEPERKERYTVFANFPEFSTLHGGKEAKQKLGVAVRMLPEEAPETLAMVGRNRGRLFLASSFDGKRILYKVFSPRGEKSGSGELKVGTETSTGWMDLKFRVVEWLPFATEDFEPRYVEVLQGADEPFLTAIRFRIDRPRQTASVVEDRDIWLIEGMGKSLSIGGQDVFVQYHRVKRELPFQLYLEKFTMGTNPGTTTAASFVSDVVVKDPKETTVEKKATISMNEPLVHGGYTFYQASYQLAPGQPAVSVFAVNYDPGRFVKYLGSIIMVLGILVMFYMNPHYFQILLGKKE